MKMKGPKDATGVSFAGKWYDAVRGVVDVPFEALADLAAHGFKPTNDADVKAVTDDGATA